MVFLEQENKELTNNLQQIKTKAHDRKISLERLLKILPKSENECQKND